MHVYIYKNRITKVDNNCIVFRIAIENFYFFFGHKSITLFHAKNLTKKNK